MSEAERSEARAAWDALATAWWRFTGRKSWLYAHQDAPDWNARDDATAETERRYREQRAALADWCGVGEDVIALLQVEVDEARERRAA